MEYTRGPWVVDLVDLLEYLRGPWVVNLAQGYGQTTIKITCIFILPSPFFIIYLQMEYYFLLSNSSLLLKRHLTLLNICNAW